MAGTQRSTVVGVFEDHRAADRTVSDLRKAGFRDDQIGVATRKSEGMWGETGKAEEGSHWETGAVTGLLAGAGLGGLVGLGIIAGVIPVLGPVIAGGTLAAVLANAAGGAAIGGIAGALIGSGIPEEEAEYYKGEFEAGRTLVTVKADGRADEAMRILRNHGAYDMHTAPAGMTTTAAGAACATPTGTTAARGTASHTGTGKMQIKEEELHARKTPVEAGEVRVRKEVVTEHRTVEVPVEREEVVIERHAATGQRVADTDIRAGEEVRIPVKEEHVTVEKHPVVTEEVTVGKRTVRDTEQVSGDVRKEKIKVETKGDVNVKDTRGGNPPSR